MKRRRPRTWLATALLVAANALIPVAILVFATGFFPYKPYLPGLARFEDVDYGTPPPAVFDKLVFMVIDALRSDFVFTEGSGFQFTQELIRNGAAIPFTAHATSPTITMPRIKAITTGSIPSFLDVILNFDEADKTATLASQDTWLAQMKVKGSGKLVMYGDDTWLKLFPETFDRADGTSSFFVSDFTEVDNNVTRHVPSELLSEDWSTMVLHYLGLDHIGHKTGPRSVHMVPKQREMDGIVRQIYEAMETRPHLHNTLLVFCGDHGMNDAGNHGASSAGETSTALVFVSPKLRELAKSSSMSRVAPVPYNEHFRYYTTVEQSDLAPTLSGLLGIPVPKNNLGAFIPDFLPLWSRSADQVQLLRRNGRQIMGIVSAALGDHDSGAALDAEPDRVPGDCSSQGSEIAELACEWSRVGGNPEANGTVSSDARAAWVANIVNWLRRAQRSLSSIASNYDMSRIMTGQAIACISLGLVVVAAVEISEISQTSWYVLAIVSVAYGIMMFASSYVEEEQHFWYWVMTAWLFVLGVRGLKSPEQRSLRHAGSLLVGLLATRLARGWNQTGQKHAGGPDIVKNFLLTDPGLLWRMVTCTYLWMYLRILGVVTTSSSSGPASTYLAVASTTVLVALAAAFKLHFAHEDSPELVVGHVPFLEQLLALLGGISLVRKAQLVFAHLAASVLFLSIRTRGSGTPRRGFLGAVRDHVLLLLATQTRLANIPLLFLLDRQVALLGASVEQQQQLDAVSLSGASLVLQFASFFAFGGSNAISSVDLSSAYNGVAGFSVGLVGVLIFVSNWAGPIYVSLCTAMLLLRLGDRDGTHGKTDVFLHYVAAVTLFTVCSLCFVMAACTVLRTHLFIWTVFSPKYLYSMAWSLGQHLIVNIGVVGLFLILDGKPAGNSRQATSETG